MAQFYQTTKKKLELKKHQLSLIIKAVLKLTSPKTGNSCLMYKKTSNENLASNSQCQEQPQLVINGKTRV